MVKRKPGNRESSRKPAVKGKIYFFSDAHLGLGPREVENRKELRLIRFLDRIKKDAAEVYIIGDLFDYWFEYKTVVPKGFYRLHSKLAELTGHRIRVCFIAGNHDFWINSYFKDELGIESYTDPVEEKICGKRFFLHHGDGLVKKDLGYRILKRILRNKINIFLFSLLHPDIAGRIARWSSRTSRQYTSSKEYESDDMIEFAELKLREGFDFVIMGHNHIPSIHNFKDGVYVNLGDWISHNTYAVFDGKKIELKKWKD